MIVCNPIDLTEYRKQIERQQAVLQLSSFFDDTEKQRINETLQDLLKICDEKIKKQSTRSIKELLELMLEHQKLFGNGLCFCSTYLHFKDLISSAEKELLSEYIKSNKPKNAGYFLYWEEGNIAPRIEWINTQIEKQSTRSIKELLELMLSHQELFGCGLCFWAVTLFSRKLIKKSELMSLRGYIIANKPENKKNIGYWWKKRNIAPRIKWINAQIEKL